MFGAVDVVILKVVLILLLRPVDIAIFDVVFV